LIIPHDATLVDRYSDPAQIDSLIEEAKSYQNIVINNRQLSDAHMIAQGAFSPLKGFMGHEDYTSVVKEMHLADGQAWPIPVTLAVDSHRASSLKEGNPIALSINGEDPVAILTLQGKFRRDKEDEASKVYRTTDEKHPGVANLYNDEDVLLGGELKLLQQKPDLENGCDPYYMTPFETREAMSNLGWSTMVGFQTRNPVHRAHEYIQKCALESLDGLLLHPLVGETKPDDISASVRMQCYKVLLDNYYPKNRVLLSVLPAFMRYAGPREAVLHALVRKNYGCTHFIVGRDHAGVGNYYGPYDAQHIFGDFGAGELGITPLFFENSFFCKSCKSMATERTCPHKVKDRVSLSGTEVREMLAKGQNPPEEFSRPEVANILMNNL
jgi:sulfate adenylyltransferase